MKINRQQSSSVCFAGLVWLSALACAPAFAQETQRLSQWLQYATAPKDGYPLGLMWVTPEEKKRQEVEYESLNLALESLAKQSSKSKDNLHALLQVLSVMPPTGRVGVHAANAKWLEANPKRDPVLQKDDQVSMPQRPVAVRVMQSSGAVCDVPHLEGLLAKDYIEVCFSSQANDSWAWQVQPDGRVQKVGVSSWNRSLNDQPAPGAWLWVPVSGSELTDAFNLRWAQWLATQGVADNVPLQKFEQFHRQARPMVNAPGYFDVGGSTRQNDAPTASNWGGVGLMQTPTARMRQAGYFGLGFHRAWPYTQAQVFLQPLDWFEAGFRYVDIANRAYGPEAFSGDQSYKDKSIDLKLQLLSESNYVPAVSVGWRDLGGTGLFSTEYLVASKRTGRLDWSAGIAWGYLGGQARQIEFGKGGTFAGSSWFKGQHAPFAGVSYESPWRVVFKAEYEANRYKNEPLGNDIKAKSPFNFGMVYKPWRGVDASVGFERGNTWSVGLVFYTDLSALNTAKLTDPPVPAVRQERSSVEPDWAQTAKDLKLLTQWQIEQIYRADDTLIVQAAKTKSPYPQVRLDKAMAVLHRDAPEQVKKLEVRHTNLGSVLAVEQVDRAQWVQMQTAPARTQQTTIPAQPSYPAYSFATAGHELSNKSQQALLTQRGTNFYVEPGLDFIQTLGGPDAFMLYQFSGALRAGLKLQNNLELKGQIRARLANNYDRFNQRGSSALPQVRTFMREYFVTSPVTMTNLTLSKTGRLSQSVYWGAYGGYFEEMFGGVGGEMLYRQPASRWAVGVDINQVRQRAFEQDLNFRDYSVKTGHITGYWATPIDGVHASLSVGQYLAGDKGATLTVAKVFNNGSVMGAFATKTNVPPEVFGEGSFDKGVFWSIPFDAFLTSSSRSHANFAWRPLTRDGGAKVVRPLNLFNETGLVGPLFNSYMPAAPSNDLVAPDDRRDR